MKILIALMLVSTATLAGASYDSHNPYGRSYDPRVEDQLDRMQRERERQVELLEQYREDAHQQSHCESESCRAVFEGRKWSTEQELKRPQ